MILRLLLAMPYPGIPWWWPMLAASVDKETISIGAVCAVITAIGTAFGFKVGRTKAVTVKTPPAILVKEDVELVTKDELKEDIERLEQAIAELKKTIEGERAIARTANGNIHARIDALSERLGERLSKMEGSFSSIESNTRTLLEIALNPKPPRTR